MVLENLIFQYQVKIRVAIMDSLRLEMKGITKSFGAEKVLKDVNFNLIEGEVHSLLGVNGAGKSTLIKILSGLYSKDQGQIFIDGVLCNYTTPMQAIDLGIAAVYQEPEIVPSLTGYENIFLGKENALNSGRKTLAVINRRKMRLDANVLLEGFPVDINLDNPVSTYSALEREVLLIIRALSRKMTILILDEPTSILSIIEKNLLFSSIRKLKEKGVSTIYISHRLEEVEEISDRITILRGGINVATIDYKNDRKSKKEIIQLMLGESLKELYPEKGSNLGEVVMSVKNLSRDNEFEGINFELRKGRVLGITGLFGSGIEELSKALFGVNPITKGDVYIGNKKVSFKSPKDAIDNGIFMIPGNRKMQGLILSESILFNSTVANLKRISKLFGYVFRKKEITHVKKLISDLNIMPPDIRKITSLLSGGNQQKVVIGKALFSNADIYIFVEPTTGVDIGAKAAIYKKIRELSNNFGVIIITTDCEEIWGCCDDFIVLFKGHVKKVDAVESYTAHDILLFGVSEGSDS